MIKDYQGTLYGKYRTATFTEHWDNAEDFVSTYHNIGVPVTIDDTYVSTLFYLLYSRYGNSVVASSDPTRFEYNVFTIIWQYGPNWVKKLDIQKKLRELTDEQILEGGRQLFNNASNPSNNPSNFTDSELQYINSQAVAKYKKGKLDGYTMLLSLLEDDVTEKFIGKFKTLFKTFNMPELTLIYEGDEN